MKATLFIFAYYFLVCSLHVYAQNCTLTTEGLITSDSILTDGSLTFNFISLNKTFNGTTDVSGPASFVIYDEGGFKVTAVFPT
jgi:hypothetical protein